MFLRIVLFLRIISEYEYDEMLCIYVYISHVSI